MERDGLQFIFMNGRGSSGKDTQAGKLSEIYHDSVTISTGDICRGAQSPDGEYGRFYPLMKPYVEDSNNGGYIPDDVMISMVDPVIQELVQAGKRRFLLTGFPRTIGQLNAVDTYLNTLGDQGYEVDARFICFSVLPSLSYKRAQDRREKAQSLGLPIRQDDKPEKIETRLATYQSQTVVMLKHLLKQGRLLIVKSNGDIPEVFKRTQKELGLHEVA